MMNPHEEAAQQPPRRRPEQPRMEPPAEPQALSSGMPSAIGAVGAIVLATDSDLVWEPLLGRLLLAWAVAAFEQTPAVGSVALVAAPDRMHDAQSLASAEGWRKVRIIAAPAGWREALHAGLDGLLTALDKQGHGAPGRLVVVHEAARPLVTPELIAAGIAAAGATGAAVAGEPVTETIKRVRDGLVVDTLPRERHVRAQTPQVYSIESLRDALAQPSAALSEDLRVSGQLASLALAAGRSVAVFAGSPENLEVCTADDLMVTEALLRRLARGG